jgi:hypothetical protein
MIEQRIGKGMTVAYLRHYPIYLFLCSMVPELGRTFVGDITCSYIGVYGFSYRNKHRFSCLRLFLHQLSY